VARLESGHSKILSDVIVLLETCLSAESARYSMKISKIVYYMYVNIVTGKHCWGVHGQ